MQFKLRTKLSLSFLLVTMLMLALVSFLVNQILADQFKAYAIDKQNRQIDEVVHLLDNRYADWGGRWDKDGLETIGINTLNQGLLLRVRDAGGTVLWDARVHNSGMCSAILENFAQTMQDQNPDFQGGYVEESRPLTQGVRRVGSVDIGYYGPYFYTETDVAFLQTLNRLLILAALFAMIISLAIGAVLASQMTRPITRVIQATRRLAEGRFGEPIAAASTTTEIGELTNSVNVLARTLNQQENLRKQLVSDVAHELRTPITILQSHLEAMIDGTFAADQAHLESCHGEVVRIAGLVGDMARLTQLEQGNLVLQYEPVDVAALLQRITTNFQHDFDRKQIGLRLDAAEDRPGDLTVAADADRLSQVIVNLVSNALKYTNEGGRVTIAAKNAGDCLTISVQDTGIGIAPEDLPYIFERFYRTDKSRARQTGGAGIGLTIAKSIIEAHRGMLTVTSEPGRGSTFTVTLPSAV